MIKNAITSVTQESMMLNKNLYNNLISEYDIHGTSSFTFKANTDSTDSSNVKREFIPFPEIAISYLTNRKGELDWDIFKTYNIPNSDRYIEFDPLSYKFQKFETLTTGIINNDLFENHLYNRVSNNLLQQKTSNKTWDFYSYSFDNSYISKLYNAMRVSFNEVKHFEKNSQNIIKSFDQYTENTDIVSIEFEGLSEFDVNTIDVIYSNDNTDTSVSCGKIKINIKHKRLKNLDYYVTTTNGVHVNYNGDIYFPTNEISYITAYLSADPTVYKTVAVKPSSVNFIPGQQDISPSSDNKIKEVYGCLTAYNAHKTLSPINNLISNNIIDFNEQYNESIILYNTGWTLNPDSNINRLYVDIECNVAGQYKYCVEPNPVVRSDEFRSIGSVYQSRLYINADTEVIDQKHIKLNLHALDITARQLITPQPYKVTLYSYERTKDNKIAEIDGVKQRIIMGVFNLNLSFARLYTLNYSVPRRKNADDLLFSYSNDFTDVFNLGKSLNVSSNKTIYVKSSNDNRVITSISVEPSNGNACGIVPKVNRVNNGTFQIFLFGKGSYKINYSLIDKSYINGRRCIDSDSYTVIIKDDAHINKSKNINILTKVELIKPDSNKTANTNSRDKFGYKFSINLKCDNEKYTPPASIIGQFNTFCEESRNMNGQFAGEANIGYIYTDYVYGDDKIDVNVWYYGDSKFTMVAPLRIYFINVDNSIYFIDCNDNYSVKTEAPNRSKSILGVEDNNQQYLNGLNQELYSVSKERKISGFVKISLALSDKPWSTTIMTETPRTQLEPWISDLQDRYAAKFTPNQISYLTYINKTISKISDRNETIANYLTSQNYVPLNTYSVLGKTINNNETIYALSNLSYINDQYRITNDEMFNTPVLGLSTINEDNDILTAWNVSPHINIDNPTIWYDLNEYYGRVKRGCMFYTTERNYVLDISKNSNFDTDLDSVRISVNISDTDKICIDFAFEMITAMINGNKEVIYCIDKNSLKIGGTIDGKRLMLKYINGCLWNKSTNKVIIANNTKSFNMVFGILGSRKRISLTFVIDEYYQVSDDIVVEQYDAPCNINGSQLLSFGNSKDIVMRELSYASINPVDISDSSKLIESLQKDKYAYSHVWVNTVDLKNANLIKPNNIHNIFLTNLTLCKTTIPFTNKLKTATEQPSEKSEINLVFGSFSLRKNEIHFEKNYEVNVALNDNNKQFYLPLQERYISDLNVKWLINNARALNLIKDNTYFICLNTSDAIFSKINTQKYIVKILCKNKLITVKSDIDKTEPFEFNYKQYFDKYGHITALSIFDGNDKLIKTYVLNTSWPEYTKSLIILERTHQTPLYYFNDALSNYKENSDYDNLLPSFSFYRDKQDDPDVIFSQQSILNNLESDTKTLNLNAFQFNKFGLIGGLTIDTSFKKEIDTIVNSLSLAIVDNKIAALQAIDLSTELSDVPKNGKPVIVREELHNTKADNTESTDTEQNTNESAVFIDKLKYCKIDLTNRLFLSTNSNIPEITPDNTIGVNCNKFINFNNENNTFELVYKESVQPNTMKYIGYLMYYYNMLYLRSLGWSMNADNDSEDMVYYMILLDKLKNKHQTFSAFRQGLFNEAGISTKYGNQIDLYETVNGGIMWKATIGYIEYFKKYYDNVVKFWEDRINAYNLLEGVLNEYDPYLSVVQQIDKYLDYIGDDGTKRKQIYFILTTNNHEDNWVVSQINNRIYQADAFYYIWNNVFNILFDGIFDFDIINDAIIKDIYNYGLYPEIEIPETTPEGLFIPYKLNKYGQIVESKDDEGKNYVWDGSYTQKYKYILDENNRVTGICGEIAVDEYEIRDSVWKATQTSGNSLWNGLYIDNKDKFGWGTLKNSANKECVLNIKGKIVERKKRDKTIYHRISKTPGTGLNAVKIEYITVERKICNGSKSKTVHAAYNGDCSKYWLNDTKCNIIKTNRRSLIMGIRLQKFLCELFLSELNKSMAMIDVIQKFFEINNIVKNLKLTWRNVLTNKFNIQNDFVREIKYPLCDFNLKKFNFERDCIYPEDRKIYGTLTASFDYYSWYDHKILSYIDTDVLEINIPENRLPKQLVHEQQIYDDFLTLNITVPNNSLDIKRKGITNTSTYIRSIKICDNEYAYYVHVIPDPALGIEPFGIYPWNINKNTLINTYGNEYNPAIWSSEITDISGLPNYTDYDKICRYIDVDGDGKRNTEFIINKVKSGELSDAPATELCYNFIPDEYINSHIISQAYIFSYTKNFYTGFTFDGQFMTQHKWSYFGEISCVGGLLNNESNESNENSPIKTTYVASILNDNLNVKINLDDFNESTTYTYIANVIVSEKSKFPFTYTDMDMDKVDSNSYKYTYIYGYILPDISYEINVSYKITNTKYTYAWYDEFNNIIKNEEVYICDNPTTYVTVSDLETFNSLFNVGKKRSVESTSNTSDNALDETDNNSQSGTPTSNTPDNTLDETDNNSQSGTPKTPLKICTSDINILPVLNNNTLPSRHSTLNGINSSIIEVTDDICINNELTPTRSIVFDNQSNVQPTYTPATEAKNYLSPETTITDYTEIRELNIKLNNSNDIITYHYGDIFTGNEFTYTYLNNYLSNISNSANLSNYDIVDLLRPIFENRLNTYITYLQNNEIKFNKCKISVKRVKPLFENPITYNNAYRLYKTTLIDTNINIVSKKQTVMEEVHDKFGFFLGSVSQWQIIQDNVLTINDQLRTIYNTYLDKSKNYPEPDYFYEGKHNDHNYSNRLFWTSSEINQNDAWTMFFGQYYCGELNCKMTSAYIRPFIRNHDTQITKADTNSN